MLFVLTKTEKGWEPTVDWLAKVIALGFQDAVGQSFGWLKERTDGDERERKEEKECEEMIYVDLFCGEKWVASLWQRFLVKSIEKTFLRKRKSNQIIES